MIITNIDAWDRREFIESMEQDQRLRDAEIEGSHKQTNFSEFMVDVFGGLYKYNPKQRCEEDITPQTEWMDSVYNEIKQLPEWNSLRERTKLNSVASSAATAEFCLQFMDAVPEQNMPHQNHATHKDGVDMSTIRRAARRACKSAAEEADKINEAVNAISYGNGPGQRQTIAPNLKREMAGRLFNDDQIRKIAELAGRMQRIAMVKQKSKIKHGTDEITDITMGDDLGRLIPSEMMKLNHPLMKLDFQKRLLEKNLMQYQLGGHETQGRGPLIVCCDESGSMRGQRDVWSKAVALALLRIAQKQKRAFSMIHYDKSVNRIDKFDGKYIDPIKVMDAITHFSGGGTDFEQPLNAAMQIIVTEKNYKKADVVFICDDQAEVSTNFLNLFNDGKRVAGFNVISVLIDCMDSDSCRKFSDQIVHVNGGNDKDALNIMFNV